MNRVRSTEARRKARDGFVSVRVGATKIGGKPEAFWVPAALAEKVRRMVSGSGKPERAQPRSAG